MTSFSIIGTGNMATAIGSVLTSSGSDVSFISRDEVGSAPLADVVIFATPYGAVASIVEAYGAQLDGKTVVDISNPLNFETFDSLVVAAGSSATAELQALLPASRVLKAFNTNFAATLATKTVGEVATTVLIAGDSDDAKNELIAAIEAGGVGALDAGSLQRAHELEAIGFLQLTLAVGEKLGWNAGFAVVR